MRKIEYLILALFACIVCSCEHDNDDPEPEKTPAHTLLIYMIGDNDLTSFCRQNIQAIEKGLLSTNEDINVVVYKDNKDTRPEGANLPELFQLKKSFDKKTHVNKIDTVYIEKFVQERNSCSIEAIKEIVDITFSTFNSEVKGLEFWGHGLSWIPESSYQLTRSTRYIGFDEQGPKGSSSHNYIQIWDLRKALETVPNLHLDYLMFDACNMASAEVAYEFSDICDFLAGSTTEILDAGFPYAEFIGALSFCQKKSDVKQALFSVCDEMKKKYPDYGTFSIIESMNMEQLANKYASILADNKQKLAEIKETAKAVDSKLQHFGGPSVGSWYYLYDMDDFVNYLGSDISGEIKLCVPRYYYAEEYVTAKHSPIPFDKNCGISISIPELFGLATTRDITNATYGLTKWGKKMGYCAFVHDLQDQKKL